MTLLRLFVIFLLATGTAACGQQDPTPDPGSPPPAAPSPPPPTARPLPTGAFGVTEQAFVQLAIATDDQVVRLLDLGARRAGGPELRRLATDLAAARRAELTALHGLLDAESVPYQNLHEGHDMPGMPTEEEIAGLAASVDPAAFDAELVRLVRAHLTESTTVARSAADQVTHPGTRAVASGMVTERATALARLVRLG